MVGANIKVQKQKKTGNKNLSLENSWEMCGTKDISKHRSKEATKKLWKSKVKLNVQSIAERI